MRRILSRLADAGAVAPEERVLAGRTCGWLFALGGVTLSTYPLLPGIFHLHLGWLLAVAGDAVVWGLLQCFVIPWQRAPRWLIHASVAWSYVLIAGAMASTGGLRSSAWIYVFFSVFFVAYFFPRRFAAAYLVLAVLVHALPLLYAGDPAHTQFFSEIAIAAPAYLVFGGATLAGKDLMVRLRTRAEALAATQGALRRVATAVVFALPAEQIYQLVARELAELHGGGAAGILRLDGESRTVVMGSWSERPDGRYPPGTVVPVRPGSDMERVILGDHSVRVDRHPPGSPVHTLGYASSIVAPIRVAGRIWGLLALSAASGRLVAADEQKLEEFGDLLSTAIVSLEDRARLAAQASSDPLTGLANHRTLQERLNVEVSRAARHGLPLSVAVIDIDQFKLINDIAGHETGDAMIVRVAECLRALARAEDVLGRVGGDEFAWVMPETTREQALVAVERARSTLARDTSGPYRVTVSIGICDLTSTRDAGELLRFADGALYWSKAHGRNQSWIYDPEVIEELSAHERAEHLERTQALVGLRALARAIDAKDPATSEHSERVAKLVGRLANAAGWPADRQRQLAEAALVHDVGKIGVPDAILRKLQPLTEDEYRQITHHADLSARIVDGVLNAEQVGWIRMHHERPDGRGYPEGLAESQITEGAALLALADAWDVMTVSRPYSLPKSLGAALQEVSDLTGRQFTATAVASLMALFRRGELDRPANEPSLQAG